MNRPKGLGRGLDALLGGGEEAPRRQSDAVGLLPVGAAEKRIQSASQAFGSVHGLPFRISSVSAT